MEHYVGVGLDGLQESLAALRSELDESGIVEEVVVLEHRRSLARSFSLGWRATVEPCATKSHSPDV